MLHCSDFACINVDRFLQFTIVALCEEFIKWTSNFLSGSSSLTPEVVAVFSMCHTVRSLLTSTECRKLLPHGGDALGLSCESSTLNGKAPSVKSEPPFRTSSEKRNHEIFSSLRCNSHVSNLRNMVSPTCPSPKDSTMSYSRLDLVRSASTEACENRTSPFENVFDRSSCVKTRLVDRIPGCASELVQRTQKWIDCQMRELKTIAKRAFEGGSVQSGNDGRDEMKASAPAAPVGDRCSSAPVRLLFAASRWFSLLC